MTQMARTNHSETSLPSYHVSADILPTYSAVAENLTEPQRAYLARQRELFYNSGVKTSSNDPSRRTHIELESQRRSPANNATLPACQRPQALQTAFPRRPLNHHVPRVFWASIILFFVLLITSVAHMIVFRDMRDRGTPSIPSPYPDEITWAKCERKMSAMQKLWFLCSLTVWEAVAVADCALAYWWSSRERGRHVALSLTIPWMALLGVCGIGMVLPIRFNCPKEFV